MNKNKLLIVFLWLLIITPVWVLAQTPTGIVNCGNSDQDPCTYEDFVRPGTGLIDTVIKFLIFGLMVPAGVIALVVAGVLLVTKPGVPAARETAKNIIKSVIYGLIIALAAYLIVKAIIIGLGPGEVDLKNVFQ